MNSTSLPIPGGPRLTPQNPWPGLAAFTAENYEFFCGREVEIVEIFRRVRRQVLTVLFGVSGLGKTSLLQAGLLPRLGGMPFQPILIRLDHRPEAEDLIEQVRAAINREVPLTASAGAQIPRGPEPGEDLWGYFHDKTTGWQNAKGDVVFPVLVFDQFEEIFTQGSRTRGMEERQESFMELLACLVENRVPDALAREMKNNAGLSQRYDFRQDNYRVVISLREDFLAHLEGFKRRMPSVMENRMRLKPMSEEQALQAVLGPGREIVEAPVAREIVAFVAGNVRDEHGAADASDAAVSSEADPVLLSLLCEQLNRRRLERNQERITTDLLTQERESIIHGFYEHSFTGIDARVRAWVEDELLTGSGYRDHAALEDALQQGLPAAELEELEKHRILHREERAGVVWLELTHDLLCEPASRSRESRVQRRQAEEAAAREAAAAKRLEESRRQFRRARKVSVFFAGLLLVAVVSLIGAVWMWLKAGQEAEELAASLHATLSKELVSPQPGGDTVVKVADTNLNNFDHQFGWSNGRLKQLYSESLSMGAEILYQHGQIKRGLEYAARALQAADHLHGPLLKVEAGIIPLRTAQAHYALGRGYCEMAQFKKAEEQFEAAIREVQAIPAGPADEGAARVWALSKIGVGDAEVGQFKSAAATNQFAEVLKFASANDSPTNHLEVTRWRVLALMGMAQAREDDVDALEDYKEAKNKLDSLGRQQKDNLATKRLLAELDYRMGYTELTLGNLDQAEALLQTSLDVGANVVEYDPDDLAWNFCLLQSYRGMGVLHETRQEWSRATNALARAVKYSEKLTNGWCRPYFYRAMALYEIGNVAYKQPNYTNRLTQFEHYTNALTLYEDTRSLLARDMGEMPEYLQLRYSLYLVTASIADAQSTLGNLSTNVSQARELRQRAVDSYTGCLSLLDDFKRLGAETDIILACRAYCMWSMTSELISLNKHPEALALYEQSEGLLARIAAAHPQTPSYTENFASLQMAHASALLDMTNSAAALAQYDQASEAIEKTLAAHPNHIALLQKKAEIQEAVARLYFKSGLWEREMAALEESRETVVRAWDLDPLNAKLGEALKGLQGIATNTLAKVVAESDGEQSASQGLQDLRLNSSGRDVSPGPSALLGDIQRFIKQSDPVALIVPPSSKHNDLLIPNRPQGWSLAPLIPGVWRTLLPAEERGEVPRLPAKYAASRILRIRRLALDFYENTALYEAEIRQSNGLSGILEYLKHDDEVFFLNGTSIPIHDFNQHTPPRLDTADRTAAYLRFFDAAISGSEGPFMVVDRAEDLYWLPSVLPAEREEVGKVIKPLVIRATSDGWWSASGTIQYSRYLFNALLRVTRNGTGLNDITQVEMSLDIPVAANLPIYTTHYTNDLRTLVRTPLDEDALEVRPRRLADLKLWSGAARAELDYINYLQRPSTSAPPLREKLQQAYGVRSWYQLLARDFAGALASSEAGERVGEPDPLLFLETNRAHALAFLARTQEAEEVYLRHRGQKLYPDSGQTWEQAILKDFDDLEKAGLTNPEFARIRESFKTEVKPNTQGTSP